MATLIEVKQDGKRWKVYVNWIQRADSATAAQANKEACEIKARYYPKATLSLAEVA